MSINEKRIFLRNIKNSLISCFNGTEHLNGIVRVRKDNLPEYLVDRLFEGNYTSLILSGAGENTTEILLIDMNLYRYPGKSLNELKEIFDPHNHYPYC